VKIVSAAIVISIIIYNVIVRSHGDLTSPISIPYAQSLFFPAILFAFLILRIGMWRVPRLLIAVALVGWIVGITITYGPPAEEKGSFAVARFADDQLEADSRIFREQISNFLRNSGVRVVRSYARPDTLGEAGAAVRHYEDKRPLIWGNKSWLNISFPTGLKTPGSMLPSEKIRHISALEPVTYVSGVGLSLKPETGTAEFLALLFKGLLLGEQKNLTSELLEERISYLTEAGELGHPWTTYMHRAYPLWQIGNYHLRLALEGSKIQKSELECAIFAYTRGASFIHGQGNLELWAALLNNEAIAMRILATQLGKRKLPKRALGLLKEAIKPITSRKPSESEKIVLKNIKVLRSLSEKRAAARCRGDSCDRPKQANSRRHHPRKHSPDNRKEGKKSKS